MARMINEMKNNFTVVHNNFLQDPDLGISERGLLMTMLSKPDDFDFSIKLLASQLPNGETAIRNTLTNLEKYGYLKRDRVKVNGKFSDVVYRISDCPIFLDDEDEVWRMKMWGNLLWRNHMLKIHTRKNHSYKTHRYY